VNRFLFVALGIFVATAQPAWAEDQAAIEANARFQEGKAFQKQGKNEDARIKYLQVLSLLNHEKALYNLANLEFSLGHFADSMKYARAYVKHPKADAAGILDMKKHYIEALTPKTGHATVTAPSGAAVTIDGAMVGTAPLSEVVDVMPGSHVFGAMGRTTEVTFAAGEAKNVTLEQPVAAAVAATPVPAVIVTPPITTPPSVVPEGEPSATRFIGPIALGVVGIAGVGVGIAFAGSSRSNRDAFVSNAGSAPCSGISTNSCAAQQTRLDDSQSQSTLSLVTYGIGGLALVGSAVWTALVWSPSRSTGVQSVNVEPVKNGSVVNVSGRF
jgi:hypothetical protein